MRVSLPDRVTRYQLPSGYAGTVATLQHMSAIAREEHALPRFRARMRELLADVNTMDDMAVARAVWDWIVTHVKYVRDVALFEHITTPARLDAEIEEAAEGRGAAIEDCESVALYAAVLFAAIGIFSAFVIQAIDPGRPSVFTHCALLVRLPRSKEWIHFDPVGAYYYPDSFDLGDDVALDGQRVEVWGALDGKKMEAPAMVYDDDGDLLSAMLGDTESTIMSVLNTAKGVAPVFGPYGAIIGGAIQAGQGIYDAATGTKYSAPPGGVAINVTTGQPRRPGAGIPPATLKNLRSRIVARPAVRSVAQATSGPVVVGPPPPAHGAQPPPKAAAGGAGPVVGLGLAALLLKALV